MLHHPHRGVAHAPVHNVSPRRFRPALARARRRFRRCEWRFCAWARFHEGAGSLDRRERGLVVPWQGTLGPSVTARIANQSSPYLRYEFEIEFKRFEADIYGFNDLLANVLTTRGLIEFPAPAEGRFTRYGGIGFGVSFIDLGRGFDSRILPGGILSLSAIGLNLVALAGVEFDVDPGRGLDLFVEGRIDHTFAYSWVDDLDDGDGTSSNGWSASGLGGFTIQAGLRTSF